MFGSQALIISINAKKISYNKWEVFIDKGREETGLDVLKWAKFAERSGAGEIHINSIDNDGTMLGYDISLIENIREKCSIPITVLGGAGSLDDIKKLINKFKIIGAAAGSLFVFKGKYRAVLISYPNRQERKPLY